MQMWTELLNDLAEVLYFAHLSFDLLDPFPINPRFSFLRKSRLCQPAHDPLTSRAIILQRVSIFQPVIKSKLSHDLVHVIDPHFADEHCSAPGTNRLFHLLRTVLI